MGQPWLRGRISRSRRAIAYASDSRHGTFFEMLPTVRQYAQSALYSQMNNTDLFAQVMARPRPNVNVRLDWRRIGLASHAIIGTTAAAPRSSTEASSALRRALPSDRRIWRRSAKVRSTMRSDRIGPERISGRGRGGGAVTGAFAGTPTRIRLR
jgi:hypothetical protein